MAIPKKTEMCFFLSLFHVLLKTAAFCTSHV